jgi:hypothetical protein
VFMQDVEDRTNGTVRLGPGILYRSIKQMPAAHLIQESTERPDPHLDDQRRRYYRLTGSDGASLQPEARCRQSSFAEPVLGEQLIYLAAPESARRPDGEEPVRILLARLAQQTARKLFRGHTLPFSTSAEPLCGAVIKLDSES